MKKSKLYYSSRQISLLVVEDGISLAFSGVLIYLQKQEVFSVIGFNFALTLLGFTYMLLKHLADVAMSRGVLQRLEKNVQQPSCFSSLCCCLQRGGGGGRVTPQVEGGGETDRLLEPHTNGHAQQTAVSVEGGEDLEAGGGGGGALGSQTATETDKETEGGGALGSQTATETDKETEGGGALGSQTATETDKETEGGGALGSQRATETDKETEDEGENGEGEEGSVLERSMEAEVEKEGGVLLWCLLFVSYSLHHSINETMDALQDGLSAGSVLSSVSLAATPLLPASLIQLAVRTGIPESFLSSVTAGTCAYVVLGISLYCYVGALLARLCITDIWWMMWATSAYKRWGWGRLGVRVVIFLQFLVALPFFPVLFVAYLMNKKVYFEWWDRQKKFCSGGREGEAFLSNVLFCFFLLEDVPSVVFNLLVALGEGNALLSIQGANLVSTLFGLAVRVVESEGSRPSLEKIEVTALVEIKSTIVFVLVCLRARRFPSLQSPNLSESEIGDEGVKALAEALKVGSLPSLQSVDLGNNQISDALQQEIDELIRKNKSSGRHNEEKDKRAKQRGKENREGKSDHKEWGVGEVTRSFLFLFFVRTLDFSRRETGDEGVKALAEALKGSTLPFLQSLNLSDNGIGDEGRKALKAGTLPALQSLHFEGNMNIGDEGVKALAEALKAGTLRSLQSFNLSFNKIGDEGVKALAEALKAGTCPSLQSLNLEDNNIGDEGEKTLAGALALKNVRSKVR
uniref:Uncharacterized protein n=1 Tax=Chromera velia CCMP2878 TaxID=1169474 RepID=A0A0G4HXL2_9ALVE|eukprot:Cvel_9289.t1-p1 / transcript=Cvel_9289.t1 / gene=Cvel_9289 / organism=Chromera_velia_CCMP2878 / gene_product=Protein NLRC3, putative / transcript_product=Protein NLRC3, putative / location=Cvel_scaffold531:56504-59398(+) / protein_length=744 / sequence_SO=supercontig / SO=protein_coding / is_pseudo=false